MAAADGGRLSPGMLRAMRQQQRESVSMVKARKLTMPLLQAAAAAAAAVEEGRRQFAEGLGADFISSVHSQL